MKKDLKYYIHCFTHLRRDNKNGGAPHKPILLLSIIDLFEKKLFTDNRIYILPELVASFKTNWSKLVKTNHHPIFALPFYHMSSEPFWTLQAKFGYENFLTMKGSMRSFNNLTSVVECAILDFQLYEYMENPEYRDILKLSLMEKYSFNSDLKYNSIDSLFSSSGSILYDNSESYRTKLVELKKSLDENSFQEEIFIRGGIFKREVPKIYNNTCAISGSRIDAIANISMLDACHIVPFAESYDDTITNGIALNPILHRAFDRGLISISDNYTVLVNSNFIENKESSYNISQFEGKQIMLPSNENFFPSKAHLTSHRIKFGLQKKSTTN